MFFNKFSLKTSKFPNKKGTFDVNLVFTATLACTKRALSITKKGTFGLLKKFGEHVLPVPPPGSYTPEGKIQPQTPKRFKMFFIKLNCMPLIFIDKL
jgi:hypothetical protein